MDILSSLPLLYESTLKMIIAASLSLIIGVERELKRKPVGLKTSFVIATFSCLLTIISVQSVLNATPVEGINVTMDPLRLAAQIVSGIGFLGAGVIMHRSNDNISGLTTAAMIWGAAGIGIAVGAGFYIYAIIAVLLVLFGVEVIAPLFLKFGPNRLHMRIVDIKIIVNSSENIDHFLQYLQNNRFQVKQLKICDVFVENEDLHELSIRFESLPENDTYTLYNKIKQQPYVKSLEVQVL